MLLNLVPINLPTVETYIRNRGRPVHINMLARTAVSAWLEQNTQIRQYAPDITYTVGDMIQFNGRATTITAIQPGYNPQQGKFQILTLVLPDGTQKHIASGISGTPHIDRVEVTVDRVQKIIAEDGLTWRTAVHNTLITDARFVTFQDEQGDQYCLAELLPIVTAGELQQAWTVIQSEAATMYTAVPTEKLVAALWEQANDGSDEYHLFAFALNVSLQEYREVQYVAGVGWMLAEHWRQAGQRPSLIGPRIANTVPEATDDTEEEDGVTTPPETTEATPELIPDLESWRAGRRNEASFTLRASHYYGRWLPLNHQTQHLFPPRPCGITIYHRFGGQETSFTALLNPEQNRILAEQAMYDTFYEYGIYPGARFTISRRGSEYDYDMRTQPIAAGQTVLVRRIMLDDEGQLKYEDIKEPLRYRVDGDLFVAAARWEDLPALFQQAEQLGQGIFGSMFEKCQQWQQERGSPPIVTVPELFHAVHWEYRLTSPATIAFELWRRLAFVSLGQGRYRFHEEKGSRIRALGLSGRRSQTPPVSCPGQERKTKSLSKLQKQVRLPTTQLTADDLWAALVADEGQRDALAAAVTAYQAHPFRPKMLFLRQMAHQRIRHLLAAERLESLTLTDFNEQVWQLGTVMYQNHHARIDAVEVENLLKDADMAAIEAAYSAGDLLIEGNQTWGSATSIYGTSLRNVSDDDKLRLLQQTLRDLLYGRDDDETRIARALQSSNGFGINIASGILHAVYPERHILYNTRPVEMLTALGIGWPNNWQQHAAVYLVYRDFMQGLRTEFDFASLTDVDWFVYGWGRWQARIGMAAAGLPQVDVPITDSSVGDEEAVRPKPPTFERTVTGQLIAADLLPLGPLFNEIEEEPLSWPRGTRCFVFQQRHNSEYEDRIGRYYSWKEGSPNSRQVQFGDRFIYYRPGEGEQVFFGTGQVDIIEKRGEAADGRALYEAIITNYKAWKPPLPLTPSLARHLKFTRPGVLGIGQAGIRRISRRDFHLLHRAYKAMQQGRSTVSTLPPTAADSYSK